VSPFRFLSIERKTFGWFLDASSFGLLDDVEIADDTVGAVRTGIATATGTVTAAGAVIAAGNHVGKRCDLAMSAAVLLCLQRSRRMCESSYWVAERIMRSRWGSSCPFPAK
jgi:hypothetical protein